MCGIYFEILCQDTPFEHDRTPLPFIEERGPDFARTCCFEVNHGLQARCYCSVLALRGDSLVEQPILTTSGCLLWNGEAWSIDGDLIQGNDALAVHNLLENAASHHGFGRPPPHAVLAGVAGPFAFVYIDRHNQTVYFGRDCFGRRSLLVKSTQKSLIICSVAPLEEDDGWVEVPADGIYVLQTGEKLLRDSRHGETFKTCNLSFPDFLKSSFSTLSFLPYSTSGKYSVLNRITPLTAIPRLSVESESVSILEQLLRSSINTRVRNLQRLRSNISTLVDTDPRPILGILFSGGLDCTLLARIIHDEYPISAPIDLLNVAFENPRILGNQYKHTNHFDGLVKESCYEGCPDRITGRASYAELLNICQGRIWNFVEINIPYEELKQHRQKVKALIFPHRTEMDLSIGCALYFASRGSGVVLDSNLEKRVLYKSAARVLISGLGADELFGGYQRHTTAFNRYGFAELLNELEIDVSRLGKRNLGRDDRVLSSWGREVRYPYLDEDVVKWAVLAPIWEKCGFGTAHHPSLAINTGLKSEAHSDADHAMNPLDNPSTAATILAASPLTDLGPEKLVLRLLAHKLGMSKVAKETKRAIQFGSRVAKMESGKTKGTDLIS